MMRQQRPAMAWQSKAVLLLVLPVTAPAVLLESNWWISQVPEVAATTLGISALFGVIVWRLKAGTWRAALAGAVITACLMYGTTEFPYRSSWLHGGLLPLLSVFLLTFIATKVGGTKKHRMGVAEARTGRNAAQVAANLGVAALAVVILPLANLFTHFRGATMLAYVAAVAALAEAAADTVSSEIGQVFGGQPRIITTLRPVDPGTDGGVTLVGTLAGILAAAVVAGVATRCIPAGWLGNVVGPGHKNQLAFFLLETTAAVIGLVFDSLLGATLERRRWINNDAVNFVSTAVAALSALTITLVVAIAFRSTN